ncbi:HNH endonuclease signature motif containing protein, partial [Chryseobacterium piscicola]
FLFAYPYHEFFECPNCNYQKAIQIDECCRSPLKIVIIDKTMKVERLLYQCINCGGIVNRSKPLSFKKFSDQIRDEINIYRLKEWKDNIENDFRFIKEAINENNFRLSNFGKLQEHYATEKYRNIRKKALIRDENKCQICNKDAEEVHHLTYENFPDEKLEDLQSLCSKCHSEITYKERLERINKKS